MTESKKIVFLYKKIKELEEIVKELTEELAETQAMMVQLMEEEENE